MVAIIGENIRNFCNGKVIILNDFVDDRFSRSKRSTDKKRYQGQTQTQFVSFGSKDSNQQTKNGLAEALSQPDLSRATVSKCPVTNTHIILFYYIYNYCVLL